MFENYRYAANAQNARRRAGKDLAFVAIANILTWGSIGFWVALLLLATTVLYTEVTAMSATGCANDSGRCRVIEPSAA